jgi:membrane-associated phospholipid phosphatase
MTRRFDGTAATVLKVSGTVFPSIIAVVGVGLMIASGVDVPAVDAWWHALMVAMRHPVLDALSHVLAVWGEHALGFGVVPAALVVVLIATRRASWAPPFVFGGLVSLLLVQAVKPFVDRARPEDILRASDSGSFPSGHVANVATLGIFIGLVYRRVWIWVIAVGYLLAMGFSRTYLHAHWLTDVLAGAVLGAAIGYAAWALWSTPAAATLRERLRPSAQLT